MSLSTVIQNVVKLVVLPVFSLLVLSGCASNDGEVNLGNVLPISGPFYKEQHSTVKADGQVVSGYHLVYKSEGGRMKRLTYVSNQNDPPKTFTFRFYGKNIVYTDLSIWKSGTREITTEQLWLCTEKGKRIMLDRNLLDFRFVGPTDDGVRCRFPKDGTDRAEVLYAAEKLSAY